MYKYTYIKLYKVVIIQYLYRNKIAVFNFFILHMSLYYPKVNLNSEFQLYRRKWQWYTEKKSFYNFYRIVIYNMMRH